MSDEEETVVRHDRVTGFLPFACGCVLLTVASWIGAWAYSVAVDAWHFNQKMEYLEADNHRLQYNLEDCQKGRR